MGRSVTSWKADATSGAILAAFGLAMTVLSYDLGWFSDGRARPGFMAGLSGTLILVTGLYIAVRAVVRRRRSSTAGDMGTAPSDVSQEGATVEEPDHETALATEPAQEDTAADQTDGESTLGRQPVAVTFVLVLIAIYAVRWLGFIVSFAVLLFLLLLSVERLAVWKAAVYAASVSALTWIVFDLALRISLPTGVWG